MIILCLAIGALVAYALYQEQKKVSDNNINLHPLPLTLTLYHTYTHGACSATLLHL
jgi:hypothetical protein